MPPPCRAAEFDASLLSQHHASNLEAFCASVGAGIHCVIVDNTNLQAWQFERCDEAATGGGGGVCTRDAAATPLQAAPRTQADAPPPPTARPCTHGGRRQRSRATRALAGDGLAHARHLSIRRLPMVGRRYLVAAWQCGYDVVEEVVGEFTEEAAAAYASRNVHGVPADKIRLMLEQYLHDYGRLP